MFSNVLPSTAFNTVTDDPATSKGLKVHVYVLIIYKSLWQ